MNEVEYQRYLQDWKDSSGRGFDEEFDFRDPRTWPSKDYYDGLPPLG